MTVASAIPLIPRGSTPSSPLTNQKSKKPFKINPTAKKFLNAMLFPIETNMAFAKNAPTKNTEPSIK